MPGVRIFEGALHSCHHHQCYYGGIETIVRRSLLRLRMDEPIDQNYCKYRAMPPVPRCRPRKNHFICCTVILLLQRYPITRTLSITQVYSMCARRASKQRNDAVRLPEHLELALQHLPGLQSELSKQGRLTAVVRLASKTVGAVRRSNMGGYIRTASQDKVAIQY